MDVLQFIHLSNDAKIVAKGFWSLFDGKTTFRRPHILTPRARAALDELTMAGCLQLTMDDRSGAATWAATPGFSAIVRATDVDMDTGAFPMTTE